MSNYFAYFMIIDFEVSGDWKSFEKNEIIEFAWVIYDVENRSVLDQSNFYIRPECSCVSDHKLGLLGIEENVLKNGVTLEMCISSFDNQLFSKCQDSRKPISLLCFNQMNYKYHLKLDAKKKGITLYVHFDHVVPLQQLILSKCDRVYEEDVKSIEKAAQKLLGIDNTCNFTTALDRCHTMANIITFLLNEGVEINKQNRVYVDDPAELSEDYFKCDDVIFDEDARKASAKSAPLIFSASNSSSYASNANARVFADSPAPIVRLRGLPWDIKESILVDFFKPVCRIHADNVHVVVGFDGRTNGEAYVVLNSIEERDNAIKELHGRFVGRRWIEVFKATQEELNRYITNRKALTGGCPAIGESVLRLRGLPWSCNEYEIVKFFKDGGFTISVDEVVMGYGNDNRLNGEAWVCMESPEKAEEARRGLHKKLMGRRYIEIFPSTQQDVDSAKTYRCALPSYNPIRHNSRAMLPKRDLHRYLRPSQLHRYSCSSAASYDFKILRMRGLPFHANEQHIVSFFSGYLMAAILPSTASIHGRPSGEAYVEFIDSHEAHRALQNKQGALMDRRYIELFPATKEEMEIAANGDDPRVFRERRLCRPY